MNSMYIPLFVLVALLSSCSKSAVPNLSEIRSSSQIAEGIQSPISSSPDASRQQHLEEETVRAQERTHQTYQQLADALSNL